jgi:hypothetical protein
MLDVAGNLDAPEHDLAHSLLALADAARVLAHRLSARASDASLDRISVIERMGPFGYENSVLRTRGPPPARRLFWLRSRPRARFNVTRDARFQK